MISAKKALEMYKDEVQTRSNMMNNNSVIDVLDTIGSPSFWMQVTLIGEVLRTITIEIGMIEKLGTSFADILRSFGRLWVYFQH